MTRSRRDTRDAPGGDEAEWDGPELDEDAMGEPVTELGTLAVAADPGFFDRVLSSLYRRDLTAQVASFSWRAGAAAFMEFLRMIFDAVNPTPPEQKGPDL